MNDEEFIQGFENCTLPGDSFHHRDHVRVAWLYLRSYSVLEALNRFCEGLKRFATANGKPNLYHETITWAYVFLIHERINRGGDEHSWEQFVAANGDLFDWKDSVLNSLYRDETLRSELAKRIFILPDRNLTS